MGTINIDSYKTGTVYKSTGSWYNVKLTKSKNIVQARLKGSLKQDESKFTNPIAVGDLVVWELEENDYVISEILPRKNYIIRQSPKHRLAKHTIASNIDTLAIVASIVLPRTSSGFIDRMLCTAEAYDIPALIIFNKTDLIKKEKDIHTLNYWKSTYENLGYKVIFASAVNNTGIESIASEIYGKRVLFSGHSGVGKSTLLNKLEPNLQLKTNQISKIHQKGTHTTTYAEIHFSPSNNAEIIDTPGIKEFGVLAIEQQELRFYFPEFAKRLNQCQFQNCMHISEPNCVVIKALENGEIEEFRYQNYLNILQNIQDQDEYYWEK